jgi:hypothetical protein
MNRSKASKPRIVSTAWGFLVAMTLVLAGCGSPDDELADWVDEHAVQPYGRLEMTFAIGEGKTTRIVLKPVGQGYAYDLIASSEGEIKESERAIYKLFHDQLIKQEWRLVPAGAMGPEFAEDIEAARVALGKGHAATASDTGKAKDGDYLLITESPCQAGYLRTFSQEVIKAFLVADGEDKRKEWEHILRDESEQGKLITTIFQVLDMTPAMMGECRDGVRPETRLFEVRALRIKGEQVFMQRSDGSNKYDQINLATRSSSAGMKAPAMGEFWFGKGSPAEVLCGFNPLHTSAPHWADLACFDRLRYEIEHRYGVDLPKSDGYPLTHTLRGLHKLAALELADIDGVAPARISIQHGGQ